MELWNQTAGAWTVEDYLRRLQCRLRVYQTINQDLTEPQRAILASEIERLVEPLAQLRNGQRASEDFADLELLIARETVNVRDAIVDAAQDEAWKIMGLRQNILASVGLTREKLFETSRIAEIKHASREVTVARAFSVARDLRALPPFDERDRLAERLETAGTAMRDELAALAAIEERALTTRQGLRRIIDAQRIAVVTTYGRLLTVFPKSFVESLFPRARNRPEAGSHSPSAPPT